MRVAFSGVGKRVQLLRSARASLPDHEIICFDASRNAPALEEGHRSAQLPRASDANFSDAVVEAASRFKIDVWLSIVDCELEDLARLALCDTPTRFIVPDHPKVCMDKIATHQICLALGIATPESSLEPLPRYPQVMKDRNGSASSGFAVLHDPNAAANRPEKTELVFQSLLEGRHLDVDFYVDLVNGRIASIVTREVTERHRGESFAARFVQPPDSVIAAVTALSESIGLRGPNNMDFIEVDGVPHLLDINARFGGNYPATHAAGRDYLAALRANISGEVARISDSPLHGIRMRKHFWIEVDGGTLA